MTLLAGGTARLVGNVPNYQISGGSVKRSLAMVCPFAIAKAFGLDAATRLRSTSPPNLNNLGLSQLV